MPNCPLKFIYLIKSMHVQIPHSLLKNNFLIMSVCMLAAMAICKGLPSGSVMLPSCLVVCHIMSTEHFFVMRSWCQVCTWHYLLNAYSDEKCPYLQIYCYGCDGNCKGMPSGSDAFLFRRGPPTWHYLLNAYSDEKYMHTSKFTMMAAMAICKGMPTSGAVTALKKGAHMKDGDVNAVMMDGKERLAIQVVLSDDEEHRKEWTNAEFRPTLCVKEYIWGGVQLGNLPKSEWVVTDGENDMIMKPNCFRNCRKMARGFFHAKGPFMKKKLLRYRRFQLLDYVTGLSDSDQPIIFVEKVKWLPN
jgi:hypothetical protein